jgi:hypothetical protein
VSDRAAVARLIEMAPAVPVAAMLNREFVGRAVRSVASAGVTQFLDSKCAYTDSRSSVPA